MIKRCKLFFSPMFCDQVIDHITVCRMHIDEPAMFLNFFHQTDHLPVVDHQGSLVSHKCFEGHDSFFFYKIPDLGFCFFVEISYCHMKTVITHAVAVASSSPFIQGGMQ